MNKRVRLTNETLNSYGTWLVTAGGDTSQFERNPVLLYMHMRGQVIGKLKDIRVEGEEITAEPVFDEATELSRQCKKQWEFGSLNMVSVGIDILETSKEEKFIKPGQSAETVTRWKLVEVSLVDIGANDDAIRLYRDGKDIMTLGKGDGSVLPELINNNKKTTREMDLKTIALTLGLPEDTPEATVLAKLNEMKAAHQEVMTLRQEKATLEAARIEQLVDSAISEKRIDAAKKGQFVELGKKVGFDDLKSTFEAMSPQVKLSDVVKPGSAAPAERAEYKKLSEVPADKLLELRAGNKDEYKRLFKAEYGYECEI